MSEAIHPGGGGCGCHQELGGGRGLPAHQEGKAKELLSEVNHIPISLSFLLLSTCLPPISLIIYTIFGCYVLFSSFLAGVEIAPGSQ